MTDLSDPTGWRGDLAILANHVRRKARDAYWKMRVGDEFGKVEIAPDELPPFGSTVEIDGIRMRIDPLMSPFNIRKLKRGRHTLHERALLAKHLREGDRVLELGGGIGMVAIHCARLIGSPNVFSYEGNPLMEPLIRENYALNGVAPKLEMKVLGPRDGEVTFFVAERFSHSAMTDNTGSAKPVQVPMEDYSTARKRIEPSVLVLDIQGGEIEFFDYAELTGLRMILVEFHPPVSGIAAVLKARRGLARAGFAEASRSGHSSVFLRDG